MDERGDGVKLLRVIGSETTELELMIGLGASLIAKTCDFEVDEHTVEIPRDSVDPASEGCWQTLLAAMDEAGTAAITFASEAASPLNANHVMLLALQREAANVGPFMAVIFTTQPWLTATLELTRAGLMSSTSMRPIVVMPLGEVGDYSHDFEAGFSRSPLRVITEDYGLTCQRFEEFSRILRWEHQGRGQDLNFTDGKCLPGVRIRELVEGWGDDADRPADLKHVMRCRECGPKSWFYATRSSAEAAAIS